jgi:hypothetical protein
MATNSQTILRTILQSITVVSEVMRPITTGPTIIYQRFVSVMLSLFGDTGSTFHIPGIQPGETEGTLWTIIFGLAIGLAITVAYWYLREYKEPDEAPAPIDSDQPPEEPPEMQPEPMPIPGG